MKTPQAVEGRSAQLAVLAQDCDQPDYTKLIQALCTEANVNLITVPASKTLGEWVGLCKLDAEGLARKVVGCSCVVVKDYGEESEALGVVQARVKNRTAFTPRLCPSVLTQCVCVVQTYLKKQSA